MEVVPKKVEYDLTQGPLYSFSDWPNPNLPAIAIGMYTIWKGDLFAYVGISGTSLKAEDYAMTAKKTRGLKQRINAHRKGGLGGDKFCVYVFERFLCKELTMEDLEKMANKEITLGELNRSFIQNNLSYRFTILDSAEEARTIEGMIKKGAIEAIGKPYLNG